MPVDVDDQILAHLNGSADLSAALRVPCRAQIGLMTREGVLAVADATLAFVRLDVIDGVLEQRWPRSSLQRVERKERFGRPLVMLELATGSGGVETIELEDLDADLDKLEAALLATAHPSDEEPRAIAPAATAPAAAPPTAASPTAASPTAASPTAASPDAASPTAASPADVVPDGHRAHQRIVDLLAARVAVMHAAAARRERPPVVRPSRTTRPPTRPASRSPQVDVPGPSRPLIGFLVVCAVVIVGVGVSQIGKEDDIPYPTPTAAPTAATPAERPFVVKKADADPAQLATLPPGAPHGLKNLVFGEDRAETLKKIQAVGSTRLLPPSVVDPPVQIDFSDSSSMLKGPPAGAKQTVPGGHLELKTSIGGAAAVCEIWFAVQNKLSRMRCVLDPMTAERHRAVEVSLIEALTKRYGPPDQAPQTPKQQLGGLPGLEGMAAMMEQFRDVRWRWADDLASLDVHSKLTDLGKDVDLQPNAALSSIELDNIATSHHRLIQQLEGLADKERKRLEAEARRKAQDDLKRLRGENAETLKKMADDL